jgi:hypothetical protein
MKVQSAQPIKSQKGATASHGFSVFNTNSNADDTPKAYPATACLPREVSNLFWLAGIQNPNLRSLTSGIRP